MLIKALPKTKPSIAARVNRAHPLARGLVGCWLLNEGAGRIVHDASGHHHNGSLSGAPLWVPGRFGHAVEFGGYDDWVSMGDCLDLGLDDVTLLAIIRYSAPIQPDEWDGLHFGAVAGKGHLDGYGRGYGLSVNSSNQVYWQIRNQSNNISISSDIALNDGQYHLAVGVCDRDNVAGMHLHIDGVQQTFAADPTPINGTDLSSPRAFAIGSRQEETGGLWFWDFQGSVAAVYVWKRVLTEAEIWQLQCDPFVLFACRQAVALLTAPASVFVDCAGAIIGQPTTSAIARVTRNLASSVHVGTSTSAMLQVIRSMSGIADVIATLRSTLTTAIPQTLFGAMLENDSFWLREAVFNAMTSAAFKLGTTLTGGWFWTRRQGCTAVYRGCAITQMDFSSILYVADVGERELSLPVYLSHATGWTYCYLARRLNSCGYQEQTVNAAAVVRLAPDRRLQASSPNATIALKDEQIASELRLAWLYCPLDQKTVPERFKVYGNDGKGQIDYENPVAIIPYRARKFYCYHSGVLAPGWYRFATIVEDPTHIESSTSVEIIHQVNNLLPEAPMILVAETT